MTTIHPSTPRPEGKRWENLPGHTQDYVRSLERALDRANGEITRLLGESDLDPETARVRQQDFGSTNVREDLLADRPVNFYLGETAADHDSRITAELERGPRGYHLVVRSSGRALVLEPRASNVVHARPGPR